MRRSADCRKIVLLLLALISLPVFAKAQKEKPTVRGIRITANEANRRADVYVDGALFTSYIWPENLKKPILFPIRTAKGTVITRGFPLEPRAGESVDHPHQVGLWLNYGNVNGVDFWNNSIYRTPDEAKHMGTIVHRKIIAAKKGRARGELQVQADWLMPDGRTILREDTKFIFLAEKDSRAIDRITTLTALGEKVIFNDSKEGMFGMRVRRELEQPAREPIRLTDINGKPSTDRVLDNKNVSGEFQSSEGKIGDDVWGTRAKWALLSGKIGDEQVSIALLDNPKNIGFPTYWMARGYGLFAANPLGQKAYATEKKETEVRALNFTLEPKHSVTFRYRVLILSQKKTMPEVESLYQNFIREVR